MGVRIMLDLADQYVTQDTLDDLTNKVRRAAEEADGDDPLIGDIVLLKVRLDGFPRLFNGHGLTDTNVRRAVNTPRPLRRGSD